MTILLQLLKKMYYKISRIRTYIFLRKCKKVGKNISLFFPITFEGKSNIEIGNHVSFASFVHIWGHGCVKIAIGL